MTDLKKLYQSDLPNRAIAVYLYLRGRANKEGFCWPAIPTMARELKMSESTVRRGGGIWRKQDSSPWKNGSGGITLILPINMFCWDTPPHPGNSPIAFDRTGQYTILSNKCRRRSRTMVPISVEKFVDMVMKNNKGYNRKELIDSLKAALDAKKHGAKCMVCGQPIWAAGSAITGTYMCFTCTTGEADDSEDYEIY